MDEIGRRRSVNWAKKALEFRKQQRKKKLKSKLGLQCPKCSHLSMFIKDIGRLLLVGCSYCQVGDAVPKPHGALTLADIYNRVCDNWRDPSKVPTWKYPSLTLLEYEYLYENVTLGRISADVIYEENSE